MNAFERFILFAPLALAVHVAGLGNELTATACAVYFWSRLVYAPLYYINVPVLRTAGWMAGLLATLTLAFLLIY